MSRIYIVPIVAAVAMIALWLFTPMVAIRLTCGVPKGPGELGDTFGSVNALFSGLALVGVVTAILLQQKELTQSTKELRNSARALTKQVELSADTSRMQFLPILIQAQKDRVETSGHPFFGDFRERDYSLDGLTKYIKGIEKKIEVRSAEAENLEKHGFTKIEKETPLIYRDAQKSELTDRITKKKTEVNASKEALPHLLILAELLGEMELLYQKIKNTKLEVDL